tara:strand:- start:142 stop:324 length:183 start_codon:yes stop_codon:yes gene_type:complete
MFNPKQRKLLAEKLADLGNIAVGSLVFGVVIKSEAFNHVTLILGLLIAMVAYGFTIILRK